MSRRFDEIIRESIVGSDSNYYLVNSAIEDSVIDNEGELYHSITLTTSSMTKTSIAIFKTDNCYYVKDGYAVGGSLYTFNDETGDMTATSITISSIVDASETFEKLCELNSLTSSLDAELISTSYLLLTARYGESQISNATVMKFLDKLCMVIFQYGPTWFKRLDVQEQLRNLTETDITTGTKQLVDHAFNPSTEPEGPNLVDGEITTVNEQNKVKYTKSKLEGYDNLLMLLNTDVTEDYINKFRKLFIFIISPFTMGGY